MARFDVYATAAGDYLLDCQSDLLEALNSRFVVPLIPEGERPGGDVRLTPVLVIEGVSYTMQTHLAAAISVKALRSRVTSMIEHEHRIGVALDLLVGRY